MMDTFAMNEYLPITMDITEEIKSFVNYEMD